MTGQATNCAKVITSAAGITTSGSSKLKPGTISASRPSSTAWTMTTLTRAGSRGLRVSGGVEVSGGRGVPFIRDPRRATPSPNCPITLVGPPGQGESRHGLGGGQPFRPIGGVEGDFAHQRHRGQRQDYSQWTTDDATDSERDQRRYRREIDRAALNARRQEQPLQDLDDDEQPQRQNRLVRLR